MTRPRCDYRIQCSPQFCYFKPEGVPKSQLEEIELSAEEAEALRLKNVVGLDQTKAAKEMNISQSSLQRLLTSAHRKVSEALIQGKSIKIKAR